MKKKAKSIMAIIAIIMSIIIALFAITYFIFLNEMNYASVERVVVCDLHNDIRISLEGDLASSFLTDIKKEMKYGGVNLFEAKATRISPQYQILIYGKDKSYRDVLFSNEEYKSIIVCDFYNIFINASDQLFVELEKFVNSYN